MVVTVSLALGRWRQEDWKLKVILSYTESSSYLELLVFLSQKKKEGEGEERESERVH